MTTRNFGLRIVAAAAAADDNNNSEIYESIKF
jgi:hypothetical protein